MARKILPIKIEDDTSQRKTQILNQINYEKSRITNLRTQKETYILTKNDIASISKELSLAKKKILTSKEQLEKRYQGKGAKEHIEKMDTEVENINEILATLNNIIVSEIDKNIKRIDEEIQQRNAKIKSLEFELKNLS